MTAQNEASAALRPPSVAVIGSGYWGRNLVRNYHRLGALRLICDKNVIVLAALKAQYMECETCVALNDVITRSDIDGVVIATPAETHYALAREALLAGKHVFVEKPLVLHEAEAEELIRLAADLRLTLMVGHLLQYHPVFARLKELASSGELGRINYIYSQRLNLGKIRREENILWSFAPHDISMILSLAGEDPESIYTHGGCYLHRKIADVTTTHLEFSSGLRAHVFVSWLHPFKDQKLVVVGDRKMAVFDDTGSWEEKLLLYPHEIKWRHGSPEPAKGDPERVAVEEKEPLQVECEHFLRCIRMGERPMTDGVEGLHVLRVLNASQRSLDADGAKMRLTEDAGGVDRGAAKSGGGEWAADCYVHPTAVIDDGVVIGSKTKVWHFTHILPNSKIGARCVIGQNAAIGPDVVIGDGCKIQNNVSVYKGVTLEDDVFCGPSMVFTNVFNPRAHIARMAEMRPTLVKKGASLGANCTIVCGVAIGRYAFIGAGAVVARDVLDHALIVGNPGRRTGWVCMCGVKLEKNLACPACGREYVESGSGLRGVDSGDGSCGLPS
ncbi:MAG: Gfo/Idh/MocA family oxidoreductase [Syntrophobacteraceae bacterium]